MSHLPVLSGRQLAKILEREGWIFTRRKGSHMIYTKAGVRVTLSIPDHKELGRGLLTSLIKDAGLSREEFVRLMAK